MLTEFTYTLCRKCNALSHRYYYTAWEKTSCPLCGDTDNTEVVFISISSQNEKIFYEVNGLIKTERGLPTLQIKEVIYLKDLSPEDLILISRSR